MFEYDTKTHGIKFLPLVSKNVSGYEYTVVEVNLYFAGVRVPDLLGEKILHYKATEGVVCVKFPLGTMGTPHKYLFRYNFTKFNE